MLKALTAAVLLCVLASPASRAESIYSEQDKLIRGGDSIGTLGNDLFGDKVNLYNGTLEFTQTDVSLPGNNALPVSVGRRLVAGSETRSQSVFGDWDLDIPHLHGVFSASPQGPNLPWTTQSGGGARCSTYGVPPVVSSQGGGMWNPEEYWHGNFIYIPGSGSQEILKRAGTTNNNMPADGNAWPLVTRALWSFRCLPAPMARGGGEGFLAISPDGTQYRFDWLVSRPYPATSKPGPLPEGLAAGPSDGANALNRGFAQAGVARLGPGGTANLMMGYGLTRQEVWILPTVVIDRHGNTVTYSYNPAAPWQLTSIQSSDGRRITLGYDATGLVTSVNDGSRGWSYSYGSDLAGKRLDRLTQPDLAYWSYSMGTFTSSTLMYLGTPDCETEGGVNTIASTGSMTHPSGATGTFVIKPTSHSRSFVEKNCRGNPADGDYAYFPRFIASKSIISKSLRDPGQTADFVWNYSYSPAAISASWLGCTVNCLDYKTVEVTDPRNVLTRYTFGNRFRVSEGQLLKVEVGPVGSAPLRTTTTRYRAPDAGPYSSYIGISLLKRGNGELSGRNTPVDQRVISQQGVNFRWLADPNSFDVMARPYKITRSSTLGASRTETTTFSDNLNKWVLGQIDNVVEASTGKMVVKNNYDTNANLLNTSRFGQLQSSFTHYTDGTLQTRSDPLGRTATFSNYKRGLAQNAVYADGKTESAVIENRGLITSVTDANNFTTSYGYDIMGRLNLITRPTGDPVTWNVTSLLFEPVQSLEYDIPAGHWRQTISTGNARTVTYFDAFWRPRLTRTFDALDEANTRTMVQRNFDVDGRTVYQSYPARSINSVNLPPALQPAGTTTTYEPLGRIATQVAASELGLLTSYSFYEPAFQTRRVNPRGFTTTMSYQVFDEPSESAISRIVAPEGVTVDIARDVFSKPKSITRGDGGLSATRSYVYDIRERLCKTVEPETGATIQDYDGANNVAWRASGQAFTGTTACDGTSVALASRTTHEYDTRNRLWRTRFGDGSPEITRTYKPDGLSATVTSDGTVLTYEYNKRRLLVSESQARGGGNWPVSYYYNPNGHAVQLTYPDGAAITYAPNALGEATTVGGYASGVNYHPNGAVAGYTLGNGIAHSLTQKVRGLPEQNRDAGVMQDWYAYDENANVASITDQIPAGPNSRSMPLYDGLDRLRTANAPGLWGSGSYTYDALDNVRTSVVGARSSIHNYDARNRLEWINTNGAYTGYAYDVQGNITGRGTTGFYFDQANRMVWEGSSSWNLYDGLGRRVFNGTTGGVYKQYMYSQSGQMLFSLLQQGMVNRFKRHVYLGGKLITEVDSATGVPEYVHTDALGSPVARTNSVGTVISRTSYEAYGKTAAGTEPNGIGFTGHVNDPDTGLVYMQQRYYDPIAGRFMSLDPVTTDANTGRSFNRYDYAKNSPYRYVDPDGREPSDKPTREYWDLPNKPDCGCATPTPTLPTVTVTAFRVAPTPGLLAFWFSLTMAEIYGKKVKESLVKSANAKAAEGGASPPPNDGDDKKKNKDTGKQQDRMLTKKEIKDVEDALGEDIHDIKGGTNASKYDLYKRGDGEVVMKPKGGAGPGEPIGFKFPTGG